MHKTSEYQKIASDRLNEHNTRITNIMNESWFGKRSVKPVVGIKVLSIGEVLQMTKKNKQYFLNLIQMMLDLLRLQFNRKYLEDFGQPHSAKYTFSYDPNMQELTLYVTMKIKGISNIFHYQTTTVFRLNDKNQIVKEMGDEFLYMITLLGNKTVIHDKDNVKEVLKSLSGTPSKTIRTATKFYSKTMQFGPAQSPIVQKDMKSTDNTIRL